jgi:hypothetical protein
VTPRIAARMLVFGVLAAYTVFGPFYRQVFRGKNPYFPQWVMFSGANTDVCEVRFHLADGTAVDRYEALGIEPWYTAKKSVRRIGSVDEVWRQGRALCSKLGVGTDLRAEVRCARRTGWSRAMDGDVNLCGRPPDRRPRQDPAPVEEND